MARFEHLPLYAKTYDFIKRVYRIVGQFRKEHKHTLGAEMIVLIWRVLDGIILVNSLPNNQKGPSLAKISLIFDRFKIRFRLAYNLGLMTTAKFSYAQKEMAEIGSMISGWQTWAGQDR